MAVSANRHLGQLLDVAYDIEYGADSCVQSSLMEDGASTSKQTAKDLVKLLT